MSEEREQELELPDPGRRAVVIWYEDTTNRVTVDAPDFTWLELPELLKAALDYAEENLPSAEHEESEAE